MFTRGKRPGVSAVVNAQVHRNPVRITGSSLLVRRAGRSDGPPVACSLEGQKQFVLDNMRAWYFWNDLLPAQVDTSQFATPDELLAFLTTFSPDLTPDDGVDNPVDRFSFINTAAADQAFFGEGKFEGFGFSSRFDAGTICA